MVREKNARQHNIHNRSMVRDNNILRVFINFLVCKVDEFVPHAHSVENSVAPDSDENIGVFVRIFV